MTRSKHLLPVFLAFCVTLPVQQSSALTLVDADKDGFFTPIADEVMAMIRSKIQRKAKAKKRARKITNPKIRKRKLKRAAKALRKTRKEFRMARNVNAQSDCDDQNAAVNPGAAEVFDGIDNNCNGIVDEGFTDQDRDGWPAELGDCDDQNAAVNPGAAEIPGNGIDDNCNGVIDEV